MKSPSKRSALWAIAIVLALTGTNIEAQLPPKTAKIGFLMSGSGSSARLASFRREFLKLGYVEGKNVTFESRAANFNYDRLSALADELVKLKVNVIVTPAPMTLEPLKTPQRQSQSFFWGPCPIRFRSGWWRV